jgi:hypothetical protein
VTVRYSMHFAAHPITCREVAGCKPKNLLRALRLALLFTALASRSGLAEDLNNAGAGPVASPPWVTMTICARFTRT